MKKSEKETAIILIDFSIIKVIGIVEFNTVDIININVETNAIIINSPN